MRSADMERQAELRRMVEDINAWPVSRLGSTADEIRAAIVEFEQMDIPSELPPHYHAEAISAKARGLDKLRAMLLLAEELERINHEREDRDESFVFALARYNPDGSADLGFGRRANGTQMTTFPDGSDGVVGAFALVPGGKLLAAGILAFGDGRDAAQFALVRYQPNGSEDTTFGDDVFGEDDLEPEGVLDGIKFQAFPGFDGNTRARANGMAAQPDGKIVLVGNFNVANSQLSPGADDDFALARFDSAVIPENITLSGAPSNHYRYTGGQQTLDRELPERCHCLFRRQRYDHCAERQRHYLRGARERPCLWRVGKRPHRRK